MSAASKDKVNPNLSDGIVDLNLGFLGLRVSFKADSPYSVKVASALSPEEFNVFKESYNPEFRPIAQFASDGFWDESEMTRYEAKVIGAGCYDDLVKLSAASSICARLVKHASDSAQAKAVAALKFLIVTFRRDPVMNRIMNNSGTLLPIEILLMDPKALIKSSHDNRRVNVMTIAKPSLMSTRLDVSPFLNFVGNELIDTLAYLLPIPKDTTEGDWAQLETKDLSVDVLDGLIKSLPFLKGVAELSSCVWYQASPVDKEKSQEAVRAFVESIKWRARTKRLSFSLSVSLAYLHPHLNSFLDETIIMAVYNLMCKYLVVFDKVEMGLLKVLPAYLSTSFGISLAHTSRDVAIPKICQALAIVETKADFEALKRQ